MKAFIDSNIFIYASYESFSEYKPALAFLKTCLKGPDRSCVSWSVIYEYVRVVTNPKLFPENRLSLTHAVENIRHFTSSDFVEIIQEGEFHLDKLKELGRSVKKYTGALIHDAHHVLLMQEHGIRTIYTADTDLHRFSGIKVINPLPGT